ncbi:uncharacterized protein LOC128234773 isoform X1 [Mya arenaria]|uniref:uncharacterized protein LOC128234773 isoform X1 n=1 Tax=Mya arenaria TaxID=6604 RepID=UPI0022E7AAAA|nr:uncharacterized protein LOC128234773 isoform X1 [Mya arenaria]
MYSQRLELAGLLIPLVIPLVLCISAESTCSRYIPGPNASKDCCSHGCLWASCTSDRYNGKPILHFGCHAFDWNSSLDCAEGEKPDIICPRETTASSTVAASPTSEYITANSTTNTTEHGMNSGPNCCHDFGWNSSSFCEEGEIPDIICSTETTAQSTVASPASESITTSSTTNTTEHGLNSGPVCIISTPLIGLLTVSFPWLTNW